VLISASQRGSHVYMFWESVLLFLMQSISYMSNKLGVLRWKYQCNNQMHSGHLQNKILELRGLKYFQLYGWNPNSITSPDEDQEITKKKKRWQKVNTK
jgi:hypothetical protein